MLFEYATVGMARVSIKGEFLQVNDAFCRIVGYSREEILAKTITIQQITHPEDSRWTLEHY
ncbi:partial putative diguanylate cyclase DgcE, partial [Gammaproteobacteria bacterium]